jgi:hypothetical protein
MMLGGACKFLNHVRAGQAVIQVPLQQQLRQHAPPPLPPRVAGADVDAQLLPAPQAAQAARRRGGGAS